MQPDARFMRFSALLYIRCIIAVFADTFLYAFWDTAKPSGTMVARNTGRWERDMTARGKKRLLTYYNPDYESWLAWRAKMVSGGSVGDYVGGLIADDRMSVLDDAGHEAEMYEMYLQGVGDDAELARVREILGETDDGGQA